MKLSIVIPVLNEEDNVAVLMRRLLEGTRSLACDLEVIFVDDGSADGSKAAIAKLHQADPRVKMISFSRNYGHQIALTAGMDAASGDAVVVMDADLQHPPELIPQLVQR